MSDLAARPRDPAVGRPIPHESAALHATGAAVYTDDLAPRTAHVLTAWPVQSEHAHALVTLDVAPALEVPGVVRVLTADDVPGVNDAGVKHDEPLFPSEAMYHGHALAWVLAEDDDAARLGAAAVRVAYEPLPSLVTIQDAIDADSFQGIPRTIRRGDPEHALATAQHVFEGVSEVGGQEHFYLETHASLAHLDSEGQVFVESSTQHPSETQEIVAHVLGMPNHRVTVQCLRMGGGFGGKEMQPHGLAAVAALGAMLTGRPVRLRLNRTQDLTMTGKRHPFHATWTAGFDDDGRIVALATTLTADGGWSLDLSEPVMGRALCHVDNAYWIPHFVAQGRIAKTNKTSQTAFRGFGGPQGMFVIEDILGRVAPLLGLDAATLRERNLYEPGQTTPYGQPVRHAERLRAIWEDVRASSDFDARRARIAAFNAEHEDVKRGLAITPVKFGISFTLTAYNQAGALVHVYKDGSVLVNHGGTEMGQGLHTKMLQVAATVLGLPMEAVRLAPTRTDKVPNTSATAASSGADLNGGAVKHACEQIRDRMAAVAGRMLGVDQRDVRFSGGRVSGLGPSGPSFSFAEVVGRVVPPARAAVGGRLLPHRGPALGHRADAGRAVQVLRVRRRGDGGRGRRVHGRVADAAGRHPARRRRLPLAAHRPRAGRGRVRAGRRMAHARGAPLGRDGRARSRPAPHPVGEHLQAAELLGDARGVQRAAARACGGGRRGLRVEGGRRAAVDARIQRARGDPRGGRGVRAGAPRGRARFAGDGRDHVPGDHGGARRARGLGGCRASPPRADPHGLLKRGADVDWVQAVQDLRAARTPCVIVTLAMVRGHAPRNGGAKMVVSLDRCVGTVGGGNLEATAIHRAREMLADGAAEPELLTLTLSDRATTEYGVQCCGGEVTMLLEPVRVVPSVAIFGLGHVGLELARVLARQPIELDLVDSRAEMLAPERIGVPGTSGVLGDAVATVRVRAPPGARGGARRPPRRRARARHDARPRRGPRDRRGGAAHRPARLDRPHRLALEVGAVQRASCGPPVTTRPTSRGSRRRSASPASARRSPPRSR